MSAAPPSTAVRARSQTVERASRILGCFTSEEPTQGLPALASELRAETRNWIVQAILFQLLLGSVTCRI